MGNTTVSDLSVGENITASLSIDENNYVASDNTTFNVASKEVTAIVTVGNIVYGDDAVVIVQSNVSGDYIVTIRDVNYTVSVTLHSMKPHSTLVLNQSMLSSLSRTLHGPKVQSSTLLLNLMECTL